MIMRKEFSTLLYNSFSEISDISSFIQRNTENLSAGMKFLVLSPFKFGGMGLPNYRLLSHFVCLLSGEFSHRLGLLRE